MFGDSIEFTSSLQHDVYNACFSTPNFRSLAGDIGSFRSLLEFTEEIVRGLEPGNKDVERVTTIVEECKNCLQQVQKSVANYNNLPTQSQWA
jgi:hypothetical protein